MRRTSSETQQFTKQSFDNGLEFIKISKDFYFDDDDSHTKCLSLLFRINSYHFD